MDRLTALTRSEITLPDGAPVSLDEVEDVADDLIELIDDALACRRTGGCG
jgi:hypothetical protein